LRGILRGKDFVKIDEAGFGGAHANDARKLQATFVPTFLCSQSGHDPLCAQKRVQSQVICPPEFPELLRVAHEGI